MHLKIFSQSFISITTCRSTTTTIENAIQALEVVMREYPANCRIGHGRNFYSATQVTDLGGGVQALNGFFQSFRPTVQGLALNVDFSVMEFYKSIPVIDFLVENLGLHLNDARGRMNGREIREWENILNGFEEVNLQARAAPGAQPPEIPRRQQRSRSISMINTRCS